MTQDNAKLSQEAAPGPMAPYVGPRSFHAGETLYGRDRETNTLVDLVIAERIVLLYSPSGAGKSSLIQAALLPALEKQAFHILPTIRVNQELPSKVTRMRPKVNRFVFSALLSLEEGCPADQRIPLAELAQLSLDAYLNRRCQAAEQAGHQTQAGQKAAPASIVLVFDQFEEALTTDPTNREAREVFFSQLGEALRDRSRWALFSMREDYIAGLDPYLRLVPTRLNSRFRLDLLEVDGAMAAIREPVRLFGMKFESKAARKLVDDLRQVKVQQPDGSLREVLGPYVEPVQLQVVCARLWKELPDDSSVITLADVEAMGNINKALSAYYDSQVSAVVKQTGVAERTVRRWFETRLITPQGIRALVPLGQQESDGLANEAVFALEKVYLIRSEKRAGATWFELAHDRLIRPIHESNARWFASANLKNLSQRRRLNRPRRAAPQGAQMTQEQDVLVFNGINGATGQYSLPPMTPQAFSDRILGMPTDDPDDKALKAWNEYRKQGNYLLKPGLDPKKLDEAGWGVIFPAQTDPAIVDALRPLLDWRKAQAARQHETYYKEYRGGTGGVRPGESKSQWLARQGLMDFGPVDPENVPYYLLLVGSPQQIDYHFQYLLDVQYAVGRICFDTVEEYANYAQSVVEAEKQQIQLARRLSFFGVCNPDDPSTRLSTSGLVQPLAKYFDDKAARPGKKGRKPKDGAVDGASWVVQSVLQDEATKARLTELLGGRDTPALLFTASHGMGFPTGDPRQLRHQGALLCQDWPGPTRWTQPVPEDFYFSADDLASDAKLWGTIAFFFACYGAGTPDYDEFTERTFKDTRAQIAANAFVARLPQRMLAHPRGGALAAIGHVERAWGYSFSYNDNPSLGAFQSAFDSLLTGAPVGLAFEYFNQRYAELTTALTQALKDARWNAAEPLALANLWTATSDAKNYVVLGDPAVRAMVAPENANMSSEAERPSIQLHELPAADRQPASFTPEMAGASALAAAPAAPATLRVKPPAEAGGGEANSFGFLDDLQHNASTLSASFNTFIQKLGVLLSDAVENAATLQVSTYTSTDMAQVNLQGGKVSGANLRAITAINLDGDINQVVPVDQNGDVDKDLWELHAEMVKQAQAARAELIKDAAAAVSGLLSLRGKP